MSASLGNGSSNNKPLPQSPSFAPRRLGFSKKEMNCLQTPNSKSHRKRIRSKAINKDESRDGNKENKTPDTPSHTANDNQYKSWLQRNGFHQLFRDSQTLSFVIGILRQYSTDIYCKLEAVVGENNELKRWKVEVGEPAFNRIEQSKLIESELKSAQTALNSQYRERSREYRELNAEYTDLKRDMRDIYSPKMMEYERLLKDNESLRGELTHLNNNINKTTKAAASTPHALALDDLPQQFHSETNSSRFDWDYMDGDEDDEDGDGDGDGADMDDKGNDEDTNDKNMNMNESRNDVEIRGIFNELTMKIETFCSSQTREHQSHNAQFAKLHENVQKLCQKQDGIIEMKKSLNSLNTSISSHSFQFQPDEFTAIHNMNEKMDKLTLYLRNLRIDQRIITLYKKINSKIEDQMSEKDNQELLQLLRSVQFEQESQRKSIANSLDTFRQLFEMKLTDIYKVIHDQNKVIAVPAPAPVKSPSISPIKPIEAMANCKTKNMNNDSLFACNYSESRLNQVFLTQFVLVLINNLSSGAQMATNKLFLCIIKITNNLLSFNNLYYRDREHAGARSNAQHLIQYKVEIENLFQNIFQNTINSVIHQLIDNKMDRVQLQSKISKLTNKLQQTNINMNQTENKKNVMMRQLQKIAKKQIYYPLITAAIIVFICGICCGYIYGLNSTSYSSAASFMS